MISTGRRASILLCAPLATLGVVFAPTAGAIVDPSTIEKSIVYIEITVTGKVTYKEPSGEIKESDPIKDTRSCTGEFVSAQGDILTAGHCLDEGMISDNILSKFNAKYAPAGDGFPQDNVPIIPGVGGRIPLPILFPPTPNVEVIDITGVYGKAFDFDIVVSQFGTAGAVLSSTAKAHPIAYLPMDDGDLGLLRLDDSDIVTPALSIAPGSPADLTQVIAIGYPGVIHQDVSQNAKDPQIQSQRPTKTVGNVSAHQPGECGFPCLEISASIMHGMSGGPTIDASKGQIVGVNSRMSGDNAANLYYVVDTPLIREFLESHDVLISVEQSTQAASLLPVQYNPPVQAELQPPASLQREFSSATSLLLAISITFGTILIVTGVTRLNRIQSSSRSAGRHRLPKNHQPFQQ